VTNIYHSEGYIEISVSMINKGLIQLKFDEKESDKRNGYLHDHYII